MTAALKHGRRIASVSGVVAVLAALTACGTETANDPAGRPGGSESTTAAPSTPASPPASTPSASPTPRGTPSQDCPETIKAVRDGISKATWGKGLAKADFEPVLVTVCRYDAEAAGSDYAAATVKRTAKASTDLFAVVNATAPAKSEPKICTKELGPTYVLRFTDNERGVLTYAAEAYGCHRLVATSFEGKGKPKGLAAPRVVSKDLQKALAG